MSSLSSDRREVAAISRSEISRSVVWMLRISLAIQCFGFGAIALEHGSPINGLLFGSSQTGGLDLSEQTAQSVDRLGGFGLLAAGVWFLVCPCFGFLKRGFLVSGILISGVLISVAAWQFLIAWAAVQIGGKAMSQYSLFGQSLRYITPLALALLAVPARRSSLSSIRIPAFRIITALWMLRIATAAVFMAHGTEAILLHPEFVDYLIRAADLLLSSQISQSAAESLLRVIGVIDIVLAVTLLADRWWVIAAYMALWGFVTAGSRVIHSGWENWPEAAIRACNSGVPLALGVYWFMQSREGRTSAMNSEVTNTTTEINSTTSNIKATE